MRAGLTEVKTRRRTSWDGKGRVCPQLLTVYCGGADTQTRRAHVDQQTHEPAGTRERCGGRENGGGEVKKENGRKADCLDEEHQSKLLRAHAHQKSNESRSSFHYSSTPSVSESVRLSAGGVSDTETSVVRSDFTEETAPGVPW